MVEPYRSGFFAFPIGFDGLYSIDQVLFESAPGNLSVSRGGAFDVAVVALKPEMKEPPSFTVLKTASALPPAQNKSQAYVVGHPMGSDLQISLNDSLL